MAHQYSQVGFNSSVEVNEVNLSLSYGGVWWECVGFTGMNLTLAQKYWHKNTSHLFTNFIFDLDT